MQFGRPSHSFERGITLIETLLTVAIAALLVFAILRASNVFSHGLRQQAMLQAATTGGETIVDTLERDAHSHSAIFTPAVDVVGASNTDGHEVDFYGRDTSGAGHFIAYCFRAAASGCSSAQGAGTVGFYSYAWIELPQNGGVGASFHGTIAAGVTSFASQTVPASALLGAAVNPYTATYLHNIGITSVVDVPRAMGFPGVIGGNPVTIVTLTTLAGPRAVHLIAGEMTTHRLAITGFYTPPPNALGPASQALAYWSPLALQQSATITESNYGTRTTTPPQVYTIFAQTCTASATWFTNPTLTPASDGTGAASLYVTPKAQVAGQQNCLFKLTDNSNSVTQEADVSVEIDPVYAPQAAYVSGTLRAGNTITFSVSERNYVPAGSLITRGGVGGWHASADGAVCKSASLVAITSSGGSDTAGNPPEAETWSVQAASAGTCSITFTDAYGQRVTASIGVAPAMSPCTFTSSGGTTYSAGPINWASAKLMYRVFANIPSSDPLYGTYAGLGFWADPGEFSPGTFDVDGLVSNVGETNGPFGYGTLSGDCKADQAPSGATPTPSPSPTAVGATPTPSPSPTSSPTATPCTVGCGSPTPSPTLSPTPSPTPCGGCTAAPPTPVPVTVTFYFQFIDPKQCTATNGTTIAGCDLNDGNSQASVPGAYDQVAQIVTTCQPTAAWMKANGLWAGVQYSGGTYDVGFTLPSGWPPPLSYNGAC